MESMRQQKAYMNSWQFPHEWICPNRINSLLDSSNVVEFFAFHVAPNLIINSSFLYPISCQTASFMFGSVFVNLGSIPNWKGLWFRVLCSFGLHRTHFSATTSLGHVCRVTTTAHILLIKISCDFFMIFQTSCSLLYSKVLCVEMTH